MDDFGDDLFDEFEKPSASSFSVSVRKAENDQKDSEETYVKYTKYISLFCFDFINIIKH